MADLSDVLNTIAQNLVTPIYPNGIDMPSIAGVQVTIGEGWPIRSQLDKDLQAGNAHVSVYPTDFERVMTKFQRDYQPNTVTAATLVLTVSGTTSITITGTVTIPQTVVVVLNNVGYAYVVLSGDTLDTIATNTAALLPSATATGNVITLTNCYRLVARISVPYTASQEIARMDRILMISVWAPNPVIRATLGAAINIYMMENYRVPMVDNFFAQVFYHSDPWTDQLEKSLIYRRDLKYIIQYATTVTNTFISIADPFLNSLAAQYNDLD